MSKSEDPKDNGYQISDPAEFAGNMAKVAEQTAKIFAAFAAPDDPAKAQQARSEELGNVARTLGDIAQDYMTKPELFFNAQMQLWRQHTDLWQNTWKRMLGEDVDPVIEPERGDRRFRDSEWSENQVFDFLKQSYLITSKWAQDIVEGAEDVDDHTRRKANFYVEQIANALSPSNFVLTNPAVLRETMNSNAENLVKGLENLSGDFDQEAGELRISQTDASAFEVGENIAVTPGKVVYEAELFQLLQYEASTEQVYKRPLLIFPPWINKFYILDLNEQKSFIKWAVAQGFTVFVVSWVNPNEALAAKTFADYMTDGILQAVDAVIKATGEPKVNAIGYCIGGTLLSATLGYMASKKDKRINAATLFTTQVDFEHAGDLKVFVDEEQLQALEKRMAEKGYLEGKSMASTFNFLRSNDLIWSYVVNNYLLGKEPFPFDLLYWNSDSTRMPAAMHSFYLRECYLHNKLSHGEMELDGVKIDLSKSKVPVYNLAARDDHIAPLPSTFLVGKYLGGDTRLVVSGSGHVAGVVNPPSLGKYQYWLNDEGADTVEEWLDGAEEHPGSWWPDWAAWLGKRSGKKVAARVPGDGELKVIEDAPGSYVKDHRGARFKEDAK
jgi:polyhydroxyalkanoate synthase